MTPIDNEDTNQPGAPRKNGGDMTAKTGWAPPGKKPRTPRTGSLSVGDHIAQLTMIEGKKSTVYSGYTVVTSWKTITGLTGTLFINFDDNETRDWLIDKNYAHVNAILAAGGMPGKTNPNWQTLTKALKDTWFSIVVKSAGKGGLYLAKLGVPDDGEDEDAASSTNDDGPGPEPAVAMEAQAEEADEDGPDPEPDPTPEPIPEPVPAPVPKSKPVRALTAAQIKRADAKRRRALPDWTPPPKPDPDEELIFND